MPREESAPQLPPPSRGISEALRLAALALTAAGFVIGALAAAGALSFGWSTTLEVDALSVQHFTDALSIPCAWLCPEARPSLELLEATRFFRIAGGKTPPFCWRPTGAGGPSW